MFTRAPPTSGKLFNGTSWTNISGATNATYTPSQADEGKALQVVVTYAGDAAGSESTIVSAGTVQETAAGDLAATLGGLTGGNALQDAAVTVTAVTHAGEDVQSDATYQWQVFNGTSWTDISGATNATYTPVEADEGKALQVVVTYVDPSDPPGTLPEITTVSAGPCRRPRPAILATLSGLTDGNAVEDTPVNVTAVTDDGTDVSASATYQWQVLDGTTWTTVGAGASYTPIQADEGKALRVVVTYADDPAGSESTMVSAGTVQDIAGGDLVATLGGLTGGNAAQGAAVSVTTVTHAGSLVSGATYQWQVFNGTSWTNISGATNATYTPAEVDEGKALQVVVFYVDPMDPPETSPRPRRFRLE